MKDNPQHRVVMVTGATSGIGGAVARRFASASDHVIAIGRDRAALLDEQAPHHPTLRTGLMRHQRLSEEHLGCRARLGRVLHEPDAAGLAPSTRMNLRLHDAGKAEPLRRRHRLLDGEAGAAIGHTDAVAAKEVLRLMLVDVHERVREIASRGARRKPRA